MVSGINVIGEPLFSTNAGGKPISRVVTVFPRFKTIVTAPGTHSCQIETLVRALNRQRSDNGDPPMTRDEEMEVWNDVVPGFTQGYTVQIRPDPDKMPQALRRGSRCETAITSDCSVRHLIVRTGEIRYALDIPAIGYRNRKRKRHKSFWIMAF